MNKPSWRTQKWVKSSGRGWIVHSHITLSTYLCIYSLMRRGPIPLMHNLRSLPRILIGNLHPGRLGRQHSVRTAQRNLMQKNVSSIELHGSFFGGGGEIIHSKFDCANIMYLPDWKNRIVHLALPEINVSLPILYSNDGGPVRVETHPRRHHWRT